MRQAAESHSQKSLRSIQAIAQKKTEADILKKKMTSGK
jgi:hypothetical protein